MIIITIYVPFKLIKLMTTKFLKFILKLSNKYKYKNNKML